MKYKKIPEEIIEKLKLNTVFIDIYDIINNELHILASLINVSDRNLDILVNGEKKDSSIKKFPQYDKHCLGYKYALNYSVETIIQLSPD